MAIIVILLIPVQTNNPGSGSEKFNERKAIQLRQKKNHGNHCNPINPDSGSEKFNERKAIQLRQKKSRQSL
jgi:hypothetical protein